MNKKISFLITLILLGITQKTTCSYPKSSGSVSRFMQELRVIATAAALKTEAIFFPNIAYAGQHQSDKPVAEPTTPSYRDRSALINSLPLSPKGKKLTEGYFTLYESFLRNLSKKTHNSSTPQSDHISDQKPPFSVLPSVETDASAPAQQSSTQNSALWRLRQSKQRRTIVPTTIPQQNWWQQTSNSYSSAY